MKVKELKEILSKFEEEEEVMINAGEFNNVFTKLMIVKRYDSVLNEQGELVKAVVIH